MADETAWLEISLIVDGEIAEAIAEVLSRYAPNGVAIESTAIEDHPDTPGEPTGPLQIRAYLPVNDQLEDTRQKVEEALWHMSQIQPLPSPTFKTIQEENWMEAWKQHYHPIPVGKHLMILPAWYENPRQDRIPIILEPGMAFGTGAHPTTQLSLELLEKYTQKDQPIFDIGCGSGILSIAAVKLGASAAYGIDIDSKTIQVAEENAALNQAIQQVDFKAGSIKDIRKGLFPITKSPVVVANIIAKILHALLEDGLTELAEPGGVLLLSGILEEQLPEMKKALSGLSYTIIEQRQIKDWVGLAAKLQ